MTDFETAIKRAKPMPRDRTIPYVLVGPAILCVTAFCVWLVM